MVGILCLVGILFCTYFVQKLGVGGASVPPVPMGATAVTL